MSTILEKIKNYSLAIFAVLAAIFAFLFTIEKKKEDTDEALLKDNEVHDQLNKMDAQVQQNDGQLKVEAQKREDVQKQIDQENKETPDDKALTDFFNNQSNK